MAPRLVLMEGRHGWDENETWAVQQWARDMAMGRKRRESLWGLGREADNSRVRHVTPSGLTVADAARSSTHWYEGNECPNFEWC